MSRLATSLRLAVGVVGITLIAACAPEIEGRLNLADIVEVAGGGDPIIMSADLRIPESSEDDCNKGLEGLAEKLRAITPLADDGACVEVDNNQFSQFAIDLPLIAEGAGLDTVYLAEMRISGIVDAMGDGMALTLAMNRTLADVQDAIGRGKDAGLSITASEDEEPLFIFTIENDIRDPVRLVANYVFVDDEPNLPGASSPITLDRRDAVRIRFSDVVAAHIADAHEFSFVTIYPDAN